MANDEEEHSKEDKTENNSRKLILWNPHSKSNSKLVECQSSETRFDAIRNEKFDFEGKKVDFSIIS